MSTTLTGCRNAVAGAGVFVLSLVVVDVLGSLTPCQDEKLSSGCEREKMSIALSSPVFLHRTVRALDQKPPSSLPHRRFPAFAAEIDGRHSPSALFML